MCMVKNLQFVSLLVALCFASTLKGLWANFADFYEPLTDSLHTHVDTSDTMVEMTFDKSNIGEFRSRDLYFYGHISVKLKLSCDNTSGTVASFYPATYACSGVVDLQTASTGPNTHEEFDFEFLGNRSGQPYILQTNLYVNGTGNKEVRMYLWFNPCLDYHKYHIIWNKYMVVFYVDKVPIRVYMNHMDKGIAYPSKPMKVYASLYAGDTWATEGGKVRLNWNDAPFKAWFTGFNDLDACKVLNGSDTERCKSSFQWYQGPAFQVLTQHQKNLLNWVADNYTLYDYCNHTARFAKTGLPRECAPNLKPY